jgi:hypothetical protein
LSSRSFCLASAVVASEPSTCAKWSRRHVRPLHRLPVALSAQGLAAEEHSERLLRLWHWDGTLDRIHYELYLKCREKAEREASPTACIIDSQSVKGAEKGGLASIRMALMQASCQIAFNRDPGDGFELIHVVHRRAPRPAPRGSRASGGGRGRCLCTHVGKRRDGVGWRFDQFRFLNRQLVLPVSTMSQ